MDNTSVQRSLVTVIKHGHAGQLAPIEIFVSSSLEDGVNFGARMQLDQFVSALSSEIGSPAMLMTQGQLLRAIQAAAGTIIFRMKDETRRIV